jgi:membrane protein implicated in regulation of membrane protease activity
VVTFYLIALIVGGALIVLSVLGADHGHGDLASDAGGEFQADAGVDSGLDAHNHGDSHGHESWVPFLSMRFWTYFFAAGGLAGLLLTYLSRIGEPGVLATASGTGLAAGLAVAYAMRAIRRAESDSSMKEEDLLGQSGRVTVAIREGLPGRIRCEIKGEIIDFLALTDGSEPMPEGADVVIVGMENGTARVIPKEAIFG